MPQVYTPESPEKELHLGRLLGEVTRQLSDGDDFGKIFDFLFETLKLIIPYDRIGIALIEGEGDARQITAKWLKTKLPKVHLGSGYCAILKGSSLEKILNTGKPRILNDLLEYSKIHPKSHSTKLILMEGIRSSLTCPLRADGKPIGLVFFSCTEPHAYQNEHIQTYLKIADEISVVIEHGRLRSWFNEDQSRGQNLRMVIHDLKNPLNVIQGFLELSERKSWYQDLDDDIKKIFTILKKKSVFMSELLNELTELSKLENNKVLDSQELSLKELIPDLAVRARELADRKEISVSICTGSRLPEKVYLSRTSIYRIMDNLISNAVKFSARGSNINICFRHKGGRLLFDIEDEGQGIPENELPKLFKEFGKTSVKPTEGEQSTGLGLAIVKKIVEQHGGEISAKSQVGKGTTFSFYLPIERPTILH